MCLHRRTRTNINIHVLIYPHAHSSTRAHVHVSTHADMSQFFPEVTEYWVKAAVTDDEVTTVLY